MAGCPSKFRRWEAVLGEQKARSGAEGFLPTPAIPDCFAPAAVVCSGLQFHLDLPESASTAATKPLTRPQSRFHRASAQVLVTPPLPYCVPSLAIVAASCHYSLWRVMLPFELTVAFFALSFLPHQWSGCPVSRLFCRNSHGFCFPNWTLTPVSGDSQYEVRGLGPLGGAVS